ncbi:hypothetical protein XACN24_04075 [Xanthomonas albilineans]|uniref:hypothetical protein n=1 Tax=Xanthomonas albilineans TaxID=29447 RepID=UPI0005F35662|nr:hypothetical protein [Xanthomonas albilineans]
MTNKRGSTKAQWNITVPILGKVSSSNINLWSGIWTPNTDASGSVQSIQVSGMDWNRYLDPQQTATLGFCATRSNNSSQH